MSVTFQGHYGIKGIAFTIGALAWLTLINLAYFLEVYLSGVFSNKIIFSVVFINLVGLILIFFPLSFEKNSKSLDKKLLDFLALPEKEHLITFPIISTFLSEQALGAFLGTVLVNLSKSAFESLGVVVSSIVAFFIYIVAMSLLSISLMRFIYSFIQYGMVAYFSSAALGLLMMQIFFSVGLSAVS